ncbi:MAG TPA: response regulator transcription factor [Rhodopila sp.]|jgi:two-component system OmpR family response regulator
MNVSGPTSEGGQAARPGRRILLIEDDIEIANEICSDLADHDYDVRHAATGPEGAQQAEDGTSDLLIVDRMLPGLDGLAIIKRLRERNLRTPVLVLSALGDVNERVRGLKAGGDDYLTKPFALSELQARVEALLRRPGDIRETELRAGSLKLDLLERTVQRHGRPIELLAREFQLLLYFMRRPEQVITRGMLLEHIWNCHFLPQSNPIDVHIGKLRRKLGGPGEPPLIQNVRGQGFILTPDA